MSETCSLHSIARILVVLALTACGAGCAKRDAILCPIPFGPSGATLLATGGGEDAPQFDDYSSTTSDDGITYVLDPIARRILTLRPGEDSCSVEASMAVPDDFNVASIHLVGRKMFGIEFNGLVRQFAAVTETGALQPTQPVQPGEFLDEESLSAAETARRVLESEFPVNADRRWLAPPSRAAGEGEALAPGELGTSPDANRIWTAQSLPVFRATSGAYVAYRADRKSDSTSQVVVYQDAEGKQKAFEATVRVPRHIGAVDIAGATRAGDVLVVAEDFALTSAGTMDVDLVFVRFAKDGQQNGAWRMSFPLSGDPAPIPTDEEVRLLTSRNDTVEISIKTGKAYSKIRQRYDQLPKLELPANTAAAALSLATIKTDNLSQTRRDVIKRAEEFILASWNLTDANLATNTPQGCDPPSRGWILPPYLRKAQTETKTYGVPYNWGGKAGVKEVMASLEAGAVAGNVCCKDYTNSQGKRVTTTYAAAAGVDCSGFVSRAWDLRDRKGRPAGPGTSSLADYASKITSLSKLQPGDAFNLPSSHVRLFFNWVDTTRGMRIRAYESTSAALCSGTCQRDLRVRSYFGYAPLGFKSE